jgi:hypothetical protein
MRRPERSRTSWTPAFEKETAMEAGSPFERASAMLLDFGAQGVEHPGGDLLDHLRRTERILESWRVTDEVRLAGLCHAVYGTDGFPHPLVSLEERDRVATTIGTAAEAAVYLYAACDRARTQSNLGTSPLVLVDRFTGGERPLDQEEARTFALVTIANELDVVRHAGLPPEVLSAIRALFGALSLHAPEPAEWAREELATHG